MLLSPIISLPEGFVSNITATMGQLFTDLSAYIILILGVLLGTLVIGAIIDYIRK